MALRDRIEQLRNYFIEDDDEEFEESSRPAPVKEPVKAAATSNNSKPSPSVKTEEKTNVQPQAQTSRPTAQKVQPQAQPRQNRFSSRQRQEKNMQQVQQAPAQVAQGRSIIAIKEPRQYTDIMESARIVKNGEAVLVNFKFMTDSQARRSIDFLTGVVFTLDGDIQNAGGSLFLVTPSTVTIDAERELSALTEGYDY